MMADNSEPMSDRWLEIFRREIALAFGTHHSGPVADAVTRNAEKDLSYLIEEYQRLRAREAAAIAIVRSVDELHTQLDNENEWWMAIEDLPVLDMMRKARALLAQDDK